MIDRNHVGKNIQFNIMVGDNKSQILQLNASNYQQQFVNFVKANNFNKQQALHLKNMIEQALLRQVQEFKSKYQRFLNAERN